MKPSNGNGQLFVREMGEGQFICSMVTEHVPDCVGGAQLIHGDCLEVMAGMEPESIDTIITDPPYGLEFMGKEWDRGIPGIPFWAAALRVAKPGAILMAMGGTRTHHRLMCAIEDAGWEIRDCMMWLYGQGFPKSHNISKAIDKAAGAEREVVGESAYTMPQADNSMGENSYAISGGKLANDTTADRIRADITAPATPDAELWDGWGTALKPAYEPIIVAMKPLDGTFAENALKHGVAGLNIDGARVESIYSDSERRSSAPGGGKGGMFIPDGSGQVGERHNTQGRWPANIIHDGSDEVVGLFPQSNHARGNITPTKRGHSHVGFMSGGESPIDPGDTGSAARFFYCAKASRAERDAGLEGEPDKERVFMGSSGRTLVDGEWQETHSTPRKRRNGHPTVKPLALMEYLCTLTRTPTGGVVLDPFVGSGTTGMAAERTGRPFIGIDIDAEYVAIAEKRIKVAKDQ